MKVSVIIPAHNEKETLPEVVKRLALLRQRFNYKLEAIIVDDGSTDNTGEVADLLAKLYPFVRVYHHEVRRGLTEALRTGFLRATGDVIVFVPADMESDPLEDVPKLLLGLSKGYDMVVGCRVNRKVPFSSKVYNFILRMVFGLKIRDANWIKAFRREVMSCFLYEPGFHRYLAFFAKKAGFRVGEVEVKYHPRQHGRSKFKSTKALKGAMDLIKALVLFKCKGVVRYARETRGR